MVRSLCELERRDEKEEGGYSLDGEAGRWSCSQNKTKERGRGVRYGSEGGDRETIGC